MAAKKPKRRWILPQARLMIDPGLQRPILIRTLIYCGCCIVYFAVTFVFAQVVQHPEETWGDIRNRCFAEAIFWLPGLMLLAPLMAIDCLQTTRRFAGQLLRLQKHLDLLADGQDATPLEFRDDDHFQALAASFNSVRSRSIKLRAQLQSKSTESSLETVKPLEHQEPQTIGEPEEQTEKAAVVDVLDSAAEDVPSEADSSPIPAMDVPADAPVRELV